DDRWSAVPWPDRLEGWISMIALRVRLPRRCNPTAGAIPTLRAILSFRGRRKPAVAVRVLNSDLTMRSPAAISAAGRIERSPPAADRTPRSARREDRTIADSRTAARRTR